MHPTEVFASKKYHYPRGVVVKTTDNLVATQASDDVWLVTMAELQGVQERGATGCVWIHAKLLA